MYGTRDEEEIPHLSLRSSLAKLAQRLRSNSSSMSILLTKTYSSSALVGKVKVMNLCWGSQRRKSGGTAVSVSFLSEKKESTFSLMLVSPRGILLF